MYDCGSAWRGEELMEDSGMRDGDVVSLHGAQSSGCLAVYSLFELGKKNFWEGGIGGGKNTM